VVWVGAGRVSDVWYGVIRYYSSCNLSNSNKVQGGKENEDSWKLAAITEKSL